MTTTFSETHLLHQLKHYLPAQTPLKDFIHHNSLHAFQNLKFYDAIFKASKIFGYQPTLPLVDFRKLFEVGRINESILERTIAEKKGAINITSWKKKLLYKNYDEHNDYRIGQLRAHWKKIHQIDVDNLVQPILFRILSSYLDQGIAIWEFPKHKDGFLATLIAIEKNSFTSFFKTKTAQKLLYNNSTTIASLLKILVGDEAYFEQYIFDQQFSHKGWSGMIATVEEKPESFLDFKKIELKEFIVFELLLEIDTILYAVGTQFHPLSTIIQQPPIDLFEPVAYSELHEVLSMWQNAFEWSYYDEMLAGIQQLNKNKKTALQDENEKSTKSVQALFCIDERECSLRTHLENIDINSETFGCPGYFGVEFYFKAAKAKFYDKLCPAPVTPKFLIKEYDVIEKRKNDILYTNKSTSFFIGFFATIIFGFWSFYRLIKNIFSPKMSPAISNAFALMNQHGKLTVENLNSSHSENGLQIGFTIQEMADRVLAVLHNIGLTNNFAPLIYVVAHGSSSANNPHHGAHDCGACSGRPGAVNSRVFSIMANHTEVRKLLKNKGVEILPHTQFVGALHDTAADEIQFYDIDFLNSNNANAHLVNVKNFELALNLNAKERSRRFASINTKASIEKIIKAIKSRSVSLFEPRPELGHGTNTLCIVGNRELTKGIFLDRRSFLNSYNFKIDLDGTFLTNVLKPLGPVCGGINLEFLFKGR